MWIDWLIGSGVLSFCVVSVTASLGYGASLNRFYTPHLSTTQTGRTRQEESEESKEPAGGQHIEAQMELQQEEGERASTMMVLSNPGKRRRPRPADGEAPAAADLLGVKRRALLLPPPSVLPLAALSISGVGPKGEEQSCALVPGGAWGCGNVTVGCEWVPGPGSGHLHMLLPSGHAASTGAALEESVRVAQSFFRLWGPRAWAAVLCQRDIIVRFDAVDGSDSLGGGLSVGAGAAIFLSLLQLLAASRLRPRVAVLGDVALDGRLVSPARGSGIPVGPQELAARVQRSGGLQFVVLPREAEDGLRRVSLLGRLDVHFASNVRELVALAFDEGSHCPELDSWLPPHHRDSPETPDAATAAAAAAGAGSNGAKDRRLFVAPTLLPTDHGDVAVAPRSVEACSLPRPSECCSAGRFLVTGLKVKDGNGNGNGGASARAAINTVRFLLLKHQADISRLLGPPAVDLRVMRLAAGHHAPVDIHIHLPQALPSPAYALPALLALLAVAWPVRESLEDVVSLGEVDAVGTLGGMRMHGRLRLTFAAALRDCGASKVLLPQAVARELAREEGGGGAGDRWLLPDSGVLVQGVGRVLDVVRACFLGDDDGL